MKITPKVLLGIALLLTTVLIFQIQNPPKKSRVRVEAYQDYFKVTFEILKKDQDKAQKTVESFNLPANVLEGVDFELDSTSSAKLAFASPLVVDFSGEDGKLTFQAQVNSPPAPTLKVNSNLKIPKDARIKVFAHDFKNLAAQFLGDETIANWYQQNFDAPGQYLVTFGQSNDFIIIAPKNDPVDFSPLQSKVQDQVYKEESFDTKSAKTSLHILKLPQNTPTFFQTKKTLYFASSPTASKDFLNAQIGNVPSDNFWQEKLQNVSFAAFWQRRESDTSQDLDLVLGSNRGIAKYLTNIQEASVIQKGNKFEGIIKFKN